MTKPKTTPAFCKKGHAMTFDNVIVQKAKNATDCRERCKTCMTAAIQKAAHTARVNRDQYRRPLVRAKQRARKPWLTCFTHRPGLLEECQREYQAALDATRAMLTPTERGRTGGRPRRAQPQTRIIGSEL